MQLVMLCRTQGVKLSDFVFREESNVGVRMLDNIAYECACLAKKALHHVAELLLTDQLWKALSSRSIGPDSSVKGMVDELSQLVHVRSLNELVQASASGTATTDVNPFSEASFLFSDELGLDWKLTCARMKGWATTHKSFVSDSQENTVNIFFLKENNVFLRLTISNQTPSKLVSAYVIEKQFDPTTAQTVLEALCNWVLHYIWHVLL